MLALLLPYVELPDLHLFGLTIHPFGIFAALGVYLGAVLTVRAGRVYGPGDTKSLSEVFTWALVGGLLGAHLLHVLGYHPELLRTQGPLVLLKFWDGVSSMGGVVGGTAGVFLYLRRRGLPVRPYADAVALGLAPGWTVARIGCAVVQLGVAHATVQCLELLARGVPGVHFYTLNKSPATRLIVSALKGRVAGAPFPPGPLR